MAHQPPELILAQQPSDPPAPTPSHGSTAWGSYPHHTGHQVWLVGQEPTAGVSEACWVLLVLCTGCILFCAGVMDLKIRGIKVIQAGLPPCRLTTDDPHETYVLLPLILGSPTLSPTAVTPAVGKVHVLSDHLGFFLSWTWLFLTLYVAG